MGWLRVGLAAAVAYLGAPHALWCAADCACLRPAAYGPKWCRDHHDVVAMGTITVVDESVELTEEQKAHLGVSAFVTHARVATLRVEALWKGPHDQHIQLLNDASARSCGTELFIGVRYLVFATRTEEGWWVGECNPSRPIEGDMSWAKALGKPKWKP